MRTTLLISFCFLFSFTAFSQNDTLWQVIPFKNGKLTYSGVVEVKNASAKDLYFNAKLWIAETFATPETMIKIDVENSAILLSAFTPPDINKTYYKLNLALQFREGKYRYELSKIYFDNTHFNIVQPVEEVPAFHLMNDEKAKATALKIHHILIDFINSLKNKINTAEYTW